MRKNYLRKKFNRKRKNTFKIFFLVVVGMTVGFAALNTTLQLIGTLNISRTTWNIHWANPNKTGGVTATKDATLKTGDNTIVEYEVNLANQGDYYEFTVDAINEGTIDAMVTGFENKVYENSVEIQKPDYLDFTVTYSDDIQIANNHLLASGTTETYKVKVQYKNNLTADQLPTSTRNLKFTFSVTYMQSDEEHAVPVRELYHLSDVVYFDPVSTNPCNRNTFSIADINNGISTCYKWRVITTDDNSTKTSITVQMDHNLINLERWGSSTTTATGPDTALTALSTETSTWTRVPNLNYTYDTTAATNNYGILSCTNGSCSVTGNNTPIATNVKARIITGEEIRNLTLAAGATNDSIAGTWSISSTYSNNWYYFSMGDKIIGTQSSGEGNTQLSWLVENTEYDGNSLSTDNLYGNINNGYYTLSPVSDDNLHMWCMGYDGNIGRSRVNITNQFGIRPVITMPKNVFSRD